MPSPEQPTAAIAEGRPDPQTAAQARTYLEQIFFSRSAAPNDVVEPWLRFGVRGLVERALAEQELTGSPQQPAPGAHVVRPAGATTTDLPGRSASRFRIRRRQAAASPAPEPSQGSTRPRGRHGRDRAAPDRSDAGRDLQ